MGATGWRRSTALGVAVAALALGAAVASAVRVGRQDRRLSRAESDEAQRVPPAAMPAMPPPDSEEPPRTQDHPPGPNRPARPPIPPNPPSPAIPKSPYFDAQKFARDMARVEGGTAGSSGIISGARVVERLDRPEQAEKMLRGYLNSHPADSRVLLELVAVLRRSGRDAQAELRKHPRMPAEWPTPILRAYAGAMSDDAVLEAAKSGGDADDREARLCEAHYYLGLLHATGAKADRALAVSHYRKAADGDCSESELADEALSRLGGSQ
jgi:hypothetical protein